ncbi:MAG: DUF4339 domain-containing protein [Verrucomicrobiota bacterium]
MSTQEFYIRQASESEARGPFSREQLVSLAENGQVTRETLYYEANTEQWVAIGDNHELVAELYPEKKILRVRAKETIASLNTSHENDRPITVNDMLAAAEGRTEDTKDKLDPRIAAGLAGTIGRYAALVMLLVSAATFALPAIDELTALDWIGLLHKPLAYVAILDLFLAILLALQVVTIYPFIRFRAALILGYMGFLCYLQGDLLHLAAAAAAGAGLYLCTVSRSLVLSGVAALIGLAGNAVLALQSINGTP